jgi:glycerol-3-phosphate acyltransferase PlsY
MLAGAAAMLGHVVTPAGRVLFGSWRGGKGVATGGGMLLGLVPVAVLVGLAAFVAVVAATRYVSLGSIAAAAAIPATVFAQRLLFGQPVPAPILGFSLLVFAFIVYTHRTNLRRLREGTEAKVTDPAGPIR